MKNILLAATILATGLPLSAATIVLTPSTLNPLIGSAFTVDVTVTGNTDEIIGFGFDNTTSNPMRATFLSVLLNPFFTETPVAGTDVSATAFPGAATATVSLATLTFLAGPQAGLVDVGISSDLGNLNEGLFNLIASTQDLTSSVSVNISAVPEPGSLSLMALAASGMFVLARRRK